MLHHLSTASNIIKKTNVGLVVDYFPELDSHQLEQSAKALWHQFETSTDQYYSNQEQLKVFDEFSAQNTTQILVNLLHEAISKK